MPTRLMFLKLDFPTKFTMESGPFAGGINAFWYDNWLVLAGFVFSLLIAALALRSRSWNGNSLLLGGIMASTLVAGLPLTLLRLGMNSAMLQNEAVGYMSMAGAAGALAVGLTFLLHYSANKQVPITGNPEIPMVTQESASVHQFETPCC